MAVGCSPFCADHVFDLAALLRVQPCGSLRARQLPRLRQRMTRYTICAVVCSCGHAPAGPAAIKGVASAAITDGYRVVILCGSLSASPALTRRDQSSET